MNDPITPPDPVTPARALAKQESRRADAIDLLMPIASHWRSVLAAPVLAALLACGATWLVRPIYTAGTTFLPPQQQQSSAASALSSLGALAGLAGGAAKSSAEQFVSLMQSVGVADRLIDRYKLIPAYDVRYRDQARRELAKRSSFKVGKKDGLITIEVDDTDPKQAAAIANDYVTELRRMTSELAISEAQQRRVFFERQMQQTRERLVAAQIALQDSGFNLGALKSEPKAAAETYAGLRAQLTTAEVKLQMMRSTLSETNLDVVQQRAIVQSLKVKTDALEASVAPDGTQQSNYVGKYRDFKYEETLFEQMSRQYELARIDEAREGALIQVVDAAQPPERKSRPNRLSIALLVGLLVAVLHPILLIVRDRYRAALRDGRTAERLHRLRESMRRA